MGQRQGRVGPHHRRRVRGEELRSGSHCVWKVRVWDGANTLALQPSGRLRDGPAGEVGLGGNLDLRRQRPGRRHGAAIGGRVRRPGQRTRPEPLPAQGVPTGQTGPQGKDVRDRPRRLRTVHKREQGGKRCARPRLDGLRQAHPVPDLRRHTSARGGTQRPRRRPRRRLVRRVFGFDPKHRGALYGPRPQLLAQLDVEYEDGTTESLATDGSWRCSTGPILYSDLLMGESYDARREMPGWAEPGFDDSGWYGWK